MQAFTAINFLLSTTLTTPHKFWCAVFNSFQVFSNFPHDFFFDPDSFVLKTIVKASKYLKVLLRILTVEDWRTGISWIWCYSLYDLMLCVHLCPLFIRFKSNFQSKHFEGRVITGAASHWRMLRKLGDPGEPPCWV